MVSVRASAAAGTRKRLGKAVAGPGPLEIKSGVCGLETVGLKAGAARTSVPSGSQCGGCWACATGSLSGQLCAGRPASPQMV